MRQYAVKIYANALRLVRFILYKDRVSTDEIIEYLNAHPSKRSNMAINKRIDRFKEYYLDKLSLDVLELRKQYNMLACDSSKDDYCLFLDFLLDHNMTFHIDDFCETEMGRVLVVYQEGKLSRQLEYTKRVLNKLDSIKQYDLVEYSMVNNYKLETDQIIIPILDAEKILELIKQYGEKRVYPSSIVVAATGNQYFDVFEPEENEIAIDAGACNGETALSMLKWGGDRIRKVYSFESDPLNFVQCERFIKEKCDERVVLVKKGCWSETKTLTISANIGTHSSFVGEKGVVQIEVTSIDDIVAEEKVTFIKMDIEGAEVPSLKGAENCIRRNHPKLAICVYHKADDLVEIPKYLLSIVPDYRFLLRHYTTWDWETVLYAYCP